MKQYAIIFTDALNQRGIGGRYDSFKLAHLIARSTVENGKKSSWEIIRMSDGIVLAQSKVAQS